MNRHFAFLLPLYLKSNLIEYQPVVQAHSLSMGLYKLTTKFSYRYYVVSNLNLLCLGFRFRMRRVFVGIEEIGVSAVTSTPSMRRFLVGIEEIGVTAVNSTPSPSYTSSAIAMCFVSSMISISSNPRTWTFWSPKTAALPHTSSARSSKSVNFWTLEEPPPVASCSARFFLARDFT